MSNAYVPGRAARALRPVLLALALPFFLGAEIAPEYYAAWQSQAPEEILIRVQRVQTPLISFSRTKPVTLNAEVISVTRSQSGLQPGDRITIKYEHFSPPRSWVGARPLPLLQRGKEYPAFLQWSGEENAYLPAAQGASFQAKIVIPES